MPTDGIITLNLKIMTARVIALDLDGTLLTPHNLTPRLTRYHAKEAGLSTYHCHGSPSRCYSSFYQALALETPAIFCCNGTPILYDYQAKTKSSMPILCPWIRRCSWIDLLDEHQILRL